LRRTPARAQNAGGNQATTRATAPTDKEDAVQTIAAVPPGLAEYD
jgi:hypothetical protein